MTGPADPSGPGAPPGAQPERTALAWRRTGLALAAGSLIAGRMLEPVTGPVIWLLTAAGMLLAAGLARVGRRRAAQWAHALAAAPHRSPGARPLALCAGATALLALACLAVVLAR